MVINQEYLKIFLDIAEYALRKLANDEELQKVVLNKAQNIADWIQIKCGKVSKRNLQESIQLAINSSIVRDEDIICRIIATITTLYATQEINRGALVGGTLLKEFGTETFPHIKERELRFAKKLNNQVFEHVLKSISKSYKEEISKFNFKKNVDYSDINIANSSWITTSGFSNKGFIWLLMNYGFEVVNTIKVFLKIDK